MFRTLVFHEIRPEAELAQGQRPIMVADGYQDSLPLPLYNSVANFRRQMEYLVTAGYHCLSLAEVQAFYQPESQPLPEKSVLLTFDDCYQSQQKYAYPILRELGLTALSFAPTGWLFAVASLYQPEYSKVLSVPELAALTDVFTYCNHTDHFHQRKGRESRPMWESSEAFATDLLAANQSELITGKEVYAYPFGLYEEKNIMTLQELNFKLAFTTVPGANTRETPPLELHRNVVPATMTMAEFKTQLGEF